MKACARNTAGPFPSGTWRWPTPGPRGRAAPAASGGDSDPQQGAAAKPAGRCPVCGKPRSETYRPFCSKRCAHVDLNRWLSGSYVIPGRDTDPEDAE